MKEAMKKSIGSSKSTVEETAKSAASAVGDVVHKTKEKVVDKQCTGDDCTHDELWILSLYQMLEMLNTWQMFVCFCDLSNVFGCDWQMLLICIRCTMYE